ncbi:hypothetical protein LCGC14_1904150 [marine sediment metagenome]|uniref:Uncharacterized protein n=1 Tax=marine sediment metagenome TaxID=412755 RepID=A0A0F9I9K7_9ZZZZ
MAVTSFGSYDAWQRDCAITIEVSDEAASPALKKVQLQAITSSVNIEGGERDIDTIPLFNLGQVVKHGPAGMVTVTFEGYCLAAGTASTGDADGVWDIYAEYPLKDTSDPITTALLLAERNRARVSILWSNDSGGTTGTSAVTSGNTYAGIRFMIADCFCTAHTMDFTDGILKFTLTFKGPAIDKAAVGNVKWESVLLATVAALSAPSTYVAGGTKF